MTEAGSRFKENIERILDKEAKLGPVPSVFLLALRDYDQGFRQLRRRVFFEMPKLKNRWGFFVLLLMLAHDRTGVLKISWKDLVAITGLARENVYKILSYLCRLGYIIYVPAKNKYRSQIFIQINEPKKYIFKKDSLGQDCRDKTSLQGLNSSDKKSLQESVSLKKANGYSLLNNSCLNKTTNNVVSEEVLERQKTLLEYNQVYREDIIERIYCFFKEKTGIEIEKRLIYGQNHCLLERFLIENIISNIQRIRWGPRIDNPIGYLIKSLEDGYILPESQQEKREIERERREKEQEGFRLKMQEIKKEAEKTEYSLIKPLIEQCKITLGMVKLKA